MLLHLQFESKLTPFPDTQRKRLVLWFPTVQALRKKEDTHASSTVLQVVERKSRGCLFLILVLTKTHSEESKLSGQSKKDTFRGIEAER